MQLLKGKGKKKEMHGFVGETIPSKNHVKFYVN
jgi:hypothetical protein